MTSSFRQKIQCTNCGIQITAETSFSRWIRERADLDSNGFGISVMDMDYIVHRYRTELGRKFQCIMVVEVKTHNAKMSDAQRDTAHVINQIMRNRKQTPTKNVQWQAGNGPLTVYSIYTKSKVVLRAFGVHVVTFEKLGPDDSQWIKWDGKEISADQLAALLRFDLDPDTLNPMDWRRHHQDRASSQVALFADRH